ncbi:MAG TPA: zf-HC2 domain-containing protein [Gammaproteobacteria bacterium]|nr:zf-HC2 domain-containing protein [Gammaproteobacteria bacterium]
MSCEDISGLLADRLKGLSSAEDERRLEDHLATCATCREEARSMAALWEDLGAIDAVVPHERMRARFHAALAAYEERSAGNAFEQWIERWWPRRPLLQAGLVAATLVVGVLVGERLAQPRSGEIAALRDDMRVVGLALLDHQSASERLVGIEWAQRVSSAPQVVQALLERVSYDPSSNVRLAAVEALRPRLDEPPVAAGLAAALEHQDTPLLQVTLADALLEHGAADGVAAVRRLLDREDLEPSVRNYLTTALTQPGATPALQPDV